MRILIVDAERKAAEIIARGLKAERYAVDSAEDGAEGCRMAFAYEYDLVILDLALPGMTGTEILHRIRQRGQTVPVLILTSRSETEEKVKHFEAGADDYLTKPFVFAELVARVKSLLRRGAVRRSNVILVADLEIDCDAQKVRRGGQAIELTAKQYALLEYMAARPGRVVSREIIVEHVWGGNFRGLTNVVDVHIRHLRSKVDDPFPTKLIQTSRGLGYSVCDVQPDAGLDSA